MGFMGVLFKKKSDMKVGSAVPLLIYVLGVPGSNLRPVTDYLDSGSPRFSFHSLETNRAIVASYPLSLLRLLSFQFSALDTK
jgi:hypothetical protein